MNKQVENYIRQARSQNLTDEEIRQQLLNAGWQDKDFNLKKRFFIKTVAIIVVILCVIGGATYLFIHSKSKPTIPVENDDSASVKLFTIPSTHKIDEWLFDMSYWLTFSKDTKQFAYVTGENNNIFLVLNGKEIREASPNSVISMAGFSPDGKSFAYKAGYISRRDEKDSNYIVVDGNKENIYDEVRWFSWSADSQRYSYWAKKDSKEVWVLDGKELSPHDKVGSFVFSPSGEGYAYSYQKSNGSWVVVVSGQESSQYQRVDSTPIFSPDGKRVAYMAQKDDFWYVIVDGQQQAQGYRRIGEIVFSLDGKELAYVAYDENYKRLLVLNGKPGKVYDNIQRVTFAPDSRLVYQVTQNNKLLMSDNGKMTEFSGFLFAPVFSPDGNHMAYSISDDFNRSYKIVLDGQKGKGYSNPGKILFSPDSKHLIYSEWNRPFTPATIEDSKKLRPPANYRAFMVIDGKESNVYGGNVFNPTFSADGKLLIYGASDGRNLWRVVELVNRL